MTTWTEENSLTLYSKHWKAQCSETLSAVQPRPLSCSSPVSICICLSLLTPQLLSGEKNSYYFKQLELRTFAAECIPNLDPFIYLG